MVQIHPLDPNKEDTMPNFIVPVSLSVEADNADHATEVVNKLLANLKPIVGPLMTIWDVDAKPPTFTVYQGHRTDVEGVEVSPALREFLNAVVKDNDSDTSGWDTDLDWASIVADDEVSEDVKDELNKLINNVGGEVKVAALLGD